MKIIRVSFKAFEQEFCIDRTYDETVDDSKNCEHTVSTLIDGMSHGTVVPGLLVRRVSEKLSPSGKRHEPVFLNLGRLEFMQIVNVGIYTAPDKPDAPAAE